MSDFTQALLISGGIFALMVVTQFGTRRVSLHKLLLPIGMAGIFGYQYLRDAPTSHADVMLYVVGGLIGVAFGCVATSFTRLGRDSAGHLVTITGVGFIVTWLVAMGLRIGFVWSVENVGTFQNWVGTQLFEHNIAQDAIAPAFVIWALTMVIVRVVALRVRKAPQAAVLIAA